MTVALAAATLLLAGAMVVLFAIVGELASRIPAGTDTTVRPLTGARLGHAPDRWPQGLTQVAARPQSVVLVLSTKCRSCTDIAPQLSGAAARGDVDGISIDLECGSVESGAEFIDEHRLGSYPHQLDENGEWVRGEFGVGMSPAALVFRQGRLESALVFHDLDALRNAVRIGREGVHE